MKTAALIVAAGLSSRMGDFKPMLNVGSISISQRIVATFRQAGIDQIVMITGHMAETLEHHLSGNGIIFLRNEAYASTQMYDSACIGISWLKGKCDRLLFTPVDIPLFTADTVRALLQTEAELAFPVSGGTSGHPVMIGASLFDAILQDSGEGGLKGSFSRCGTDPVLVDVPDRGILHDADTPEDYQSLLDYHNRQLVRPVISVSLSREKTFFDERTALLLRLIDETGSVRTACQRMQMSYSSGWNVIRALESQTHAELTVRSQGGATGGKSRLTAQGRQLLAAYERYAADVRRYADSRFAAFFSDIF